MAQWVNVLAAKPNDLRSIPGTHVVGELIFTSCPLTPTCAL